MDRFERGRNKRAAMVASRRYYEARNSMLPFDAGSISETYLIVSDMEVVREFAGIREAIEGADYE